MTTSGTDAVLTNIREAYVRPPGVFGHYGAESRGREFDALMARVRRDAWDEGVDAFEVAHNIDNVDPWAHLRDNPYPEADRDEWRQAALEERAGLLDALDQLKVRDTRIRAAVAILDEDTRWQNEEHLLARVREALDGDA